MPNYVPGEGPSNAKLVAVGEAPGGEEDRLSRPFVGPSGRLIDSVFQELGCPRESIYVTNVVKHRPPDNNLKKLSLIGKRIEDYLPQLFDEINAIKPNAILALGGTALEALTQYNGIEKYRGSILQSNLGIKLIPTLHPASIFHGEAEGKMKSWKDLTYIKWDIARAINESAFPEYIIPQRNLTVCKNSQMLYRFLNMNQGKDLVSVDIETFKTFPICIGLAFDSTSAISIPLLNFPTNSGMTYMDLTDCWRMVAELLIDPNIRKIGQNFKFDEGLLTTCFDGQHNFGLKIRGFFYDTLLAFRVLYPELPGALQFSTSVLTEEPYYKDEGKEYNPKKDKFDRLLLYNAKDAVVTYEIYEKTLLELQERKLDKFFFEFQMPLHPFYSRMEKRGILRDNKVKLFLNEKYKDQQETLQTELNELTKEYFDDPINVNSNGARGDVPKLIFGAMKVPIRKGTDEKTLDALMRNAIKDPKKRRIIELILEIRKVKKTIGTYINSEVDYRGRTLTSVRIILETGRTSTSLLKPPVTTRKMGMALQTITKHGDIGSDLRDEFIPDPGYALIEPDLSGAEARVVAHLARDVRLLKAFKYDIDIHRLTKAWIDFSAPDELFGQFLNEECEERCLELSKEINSILKSFINDEERQIGKKFRHAGNYDMQKRTAAENAGVSEWLAGQILTKFHSTNPNIKEVFHKEVIEALRDNNHTLISPNGRARMFLDKWGHDLFKEAYAQIPQSTVTDQTKKAARECERRIEELMILLESHDSFLGQVPIMIGEQYPFRIIDRAIPIIYEEMQSPIDFKMCSLPRGELIIPCEIKMSDKNWGVMEKIR
jgi:uracil-DNA glycosylase family 4